MAIPGGERARDRGDPRLGHGVSRADFTPEQRLQPLFFLGLSAVLVQYFHVARIRGGTVEYLGRNVGLTHLFRQVGVLHRVETGSVLVGQEKIPQAARAGFFLERFHDLGLPVGETPAIPHVDFVEKLALDGFDLLRHEILHALQYGRDLVTDSQIHCSLLYWLYVL